MGLYSPRELERETLISVCEDALRSGNKVLHVFPEQGSVHVAIWRTSRWEVDERDVGPGPHERPSRLGFPSLRFAEEQDFSSGALAPVGAQPAVGGDGMHVMPLGPVRADVAESLRYEMDVLGDEIHGLSLRSGYKRRGIAGLMQGAAIGTALEIAERVTGTSNVAHTLAFSQAAEAALGLVPSEGMALLRSALAELERLHSHIGDLAALAASTGTVAAAAELHRLRETVLRFAARWTGHRYLRGVIAPGGWRRELADVSSELVPLLEDLEREFLAVRRSLDHTNSFLDRLHGAGRIPKDLQLELVGVVGRSAGTVEDVRWDRPYDGYPELCHGRRPPGFAAGDAFGRYFVRCEEIVQSVAMLRRVGGVRQEVSPPVEDGADGVGYGLIESPRGRLFYRVALRGGRVDTCRIRTASSVNWVAVPHAVANHNILQDFPIIDASFNLAVASLDL